MRYVLSFYDMIDGWIRELDSSDDLEAMTKEMDRGQAGLGEANKAAASIMAGSISRLGERCTAGLRIVGVCYGKPLSTNALMRADPD